MKSLLAIVSLAFLWPSTPARAQLTRADILQNLNDLTPNQAGVSMGQWYTIVRDVEAAKRFWMLMGGTPVKLDERDAVKFHGVLVFLKKGEPSGDGSIVDHTGFRISQAHALVAKLKATSVKTDPGAGEKKGGFYIYSPDGMKVELIEDENLAVPIVSDHVHFAAPDSAVEAMQAWYVKIFGAKAFLDSVTNPAKPTASANIPGVQLKFGRTPITPSPTHGRTLDRIGFEVKNLEAFCGKLQTAGVKFDQPYRKAPHANYASAQLTDPWGTSIELTEGQSQ